MNQPNRRGEVDEVQRQTTKTHGRQRCERGEKGLEGQMPLGRREREGRSQGRKIPGHGMNLGREQGHQGRACGTDVPAPKAGGTDVPRPWHGSWARRKGVGRTSQRWEEREVAPAVRRTRMRKRGERGQKEEAHSGATPNGDKASPAGRRKHPTANAANGCPGLTRRHPDHRPQVG